MSDVSVNLLPFNQIGQLDLVPLILGQYYLCKYCNRYLGKGKVPCISRLNNLEENRAGRVIDIVDDDGNLIEKYTMTQEDVDTLDLSELELSLISRSMIFIYLIAFYIVIKNQIFSFI